MSGCCPAHDDRFLEDHFLAVARRRIDASGLKFQQAVKAAEQQRLSGAVIAEQEGDASPSDIEGN